LLRVIYILYLLLCPLFLILVFELRGGLSPAGQSHEKFAQERNKVEIYLIPGS
jgi:hypothetical protein